jgi:hypothetical protein
MSPLHSDNPFHPLQLHISPSCHVPTKPFNNFLPYIHLWIDNRLCQHIPMRPSVLLHDDVEGAVFIEIALVDSKPEALIMFGRVGREKPMPHSILSTLKEPPGGTALAACFEK